MEAKKIVVAANSTLPMKRVSTMLPPKPNSTDKVPVVRASTKRASSVIGPKGGLQLRGKLGGGASGDFMDMVVEDGGEALRGARRRAGNVLIPFVMRLHEE